jgi:plasmid replication initiation protein
LVARKNAGLPIGKVVRFNAHDMMVATNRQTDGHSYARLKDALVRLRGTTFETTVETGGKAPDEVFGIVEKAHVVRDQPVTGRMEAVEVVLSDFLFRAIESDQVLSIHRDYFRLRSPVDRRLYELARKHCGKQEQWSIGLELLKDKVAFSSNERKLRFHIRKLTGSQHLPDYSVELADDIVTFRRKVRVEAPTPQIEPSKNAGMEGQKPRRIEVSEEAMEQVREMAPGWDKYYLQRAYIDFFTPRGPAEKSEDGRFLAWIPNFTKGRKP